MAGHGKVRDDGYILVHYLFDGRFNVNFPEYDFLDSTEE